MTDPVRDVIAAELAAIQQIATTPVAGGYGIDLVCVEDIDARASETDPDSYAALAQDLFHRITTERAEVPDAPDVGAGVAGYLSGEAQSGDLRSIEGRVALECQKDDRVAFVEVTAELGSDAKTLALTVIVTPEDSDLTAFTLIIAVTDGAATLEAILKES